MDKPDTLLNAARCSPLCALFYAGVLIAFVSSADGQTIEEKFRKYRQEAAQEKLYVHTDQDLYLTGESIWLKIYAVDGSFHRPSDLSSVAYVELITEDGVAVLQAKVTIQYGHGAATLFLPATISSGNYLLRAYTRWMQNFDTELFFQKTISIVNTFIRLEPAAAAAKTFDASFFPEGGHLVADLEGRIAFKVSDANGRGINFRGSLIDEQNDTLLHFQPLRFGMGSFIFKPNASSEYRAVISTNGARKIVDLPAVELSGYSMKVAENNALLTVAIRSSPAPVGSSSVLLFVHSRQIIAKAIQAPLTGGLAVFELKVSDLPEGISHLTAFNSDQQPVCERLYFKRPANPLQIEASTDKAEYGTRSAVKLNIKSTEKSRLSVSVYRLDSLSRPASNGILEYLWLSSDLRGFIESPEYYFEPGTGAALAADNLMLTQGWRRFKWNEVLTGPPIINFIPEYLSHNIHGVVKGPSGQILPGVLTHLASPDKVINTYGARSNTEGKVIYSVRNLYGPRKLITHAGSTGRVELENPFSKPSTTRQVQAFQLRPGTESDLLARSVWMQVQDIYFDEKIRPVNFDSTSFYGRADERYILDDYTRFPVMEEVLREYVPGVMVRKHRDGYHFLLINAVSKKMIEESPFVLIDGVPIFDINKVMAFDPLRVRQLDVVNRKFYLGNLVLPGVVSFTTYTGDMAGFPLDEQYVTINYDGLNLQREFYSPNYENNKQVRLPDERSLLYWNPDVTGTAEGALLGFHSSDVEGTFLVIVEGISAQGKAGRHTYQFKIKK
jgi:hypothetical protein